MTTTWASGRSHSEPERRRRMQRERKEQWTERMKETTKKGR